MGRLEHKQESRMRNPLWFRTEKKIWVYDKVKNEYRKYEAPELAERPKFATILIPEYTAGYKIQLRQGV